MTWGREIPQIFAFFQHLKIYVWIFENLLFSFLKNYIRILAYTEMQKYMNLSKLNDNEFNVD